MWPWTCHGLSPAFCSPFLDNFGNDVPFLPLAALCHVCLSRKLLETSALCAGLRRTRQCSPLVLQVPWVSLGKPSLRTITPEPGEHHWIGTGAGVAESLRICAATQEMCEPSFAATDFAVHVQLAGSRPIPRGAQRHFGWLHDAAVASFPCDALPLLPFSFCCCAGLSRSCLGSIEQNK